MATDTNLKKKKTINITIKTTTDKTSFLVFEKHGELLVTTVDIFFTNHSPNQKPRINS